MNYDASQELVFVMSLLNQIIWRIIKTRPFNRILPRIYHVSVYQLKGKTKPNGSGLSTVVFGIKETAEYFSKLVYIEPPDIKFVQRIPLNQFSSFAEKINADLTIVDSNVSLSSFLIDKGFFVLPSLDFVLDIDVSLESIRSRFTESKLKRLKHLEKANYTYEITKDPAKIKYFYNEIYLPSVLSRYGKAARPVSFHECERLFLKGFLLLIKFSSEYISGVILVPEGDELYFPVANAKEIQGSITIGNLLVYNQAILWGKQNGFKTMDFGQSPPFLFDGGLLMKKSWGMRIRPTKRTDANMLALKFSNLDKGVTDLLLSNPFVFVKGTKLNGLIFLGSDVASLRRSHIRGLSDLFAISPVLDTSVCVDLKLQQLPSEQYDQIFSSQTQFTKLCIEKGYAIYRLGF